jgi:ribosomal 50S subunit-recycling heat shock protein
MRIDKFLKVARVIKRRVLAKEAIEKNRVYINDKLAKPSHEVNIGDTVEVKMHHFYLKFQINSLLQPNPKRDDGPMITVLEEKDETIDA